MRNNVFRDINPLVTNGINHRYHLGESTFILGELGVILIFFSHSLTFSIIRFSKQTIYPRCAASHLVLCCLPMSHKKDASVIRVNFKMSSVNVPNNVLKIGLVQKSHS